MMTDRHERVGNATVLSYGLPDGEWSCSRPAPFNIITDALNKSREGKSPMHMVLLTDATVHI